MITDRPDDPEAEPYIPGLNHRESADEAYDRYESDREDDSDNESA